MDEERRDGSSMEEYSGRSEKQKSNGDYGASADDGVGDLSGKASLSQQDITAETEQTALRLVESDSSETERKRRKRRKKIERRKKRKKRRKKIQRVLLILLIIGILTGIAFWLFFSSTIFAVSEITVNHNTLKSDKYIIAESGIQAGKNIFQFKRSEAEKEILAQNPYISDVTISRKLPNRVIITVTEHAPVAAVKYDGKYLILDKNGKVAGVEKTQLTATRLTGVEVKQYTEGKVPIVQNSSVLKQSLKLINKVNASGLYFKKLDVSSSMIMHGYITDDLECTGEAEDLIENLEGIKAIVYDLSQKKSMKGTIYVGDDGYATFSPASSGSSGTAGSSAESAEKSASASGSSDKSGTSGEKNTSSSGSSDKSGTSGEKSTSSSSSSDKSGTSGEKSTSSSSSSDKSGTSGEKSTSSSNSSGNSGTGSEKNTSSSSSSDKSGTSGEKSTSSSSSSDKSETSGEKSTSSSSSSGNSGQAVNSNTNNQL